MLEQVRAEHAVDRAVGQWQRARVGEQRPLRPITAEGDGLPLDMGADDEIVCPYCSTLYRYSPKLAAGASEQDKAFYTGKIEGAKFYINRTTSLVPAKCEVLVKDEISAVRIPDEAFAV